MDRAVSEITQRVNSLLPADIPTHKRKQHRGKNLAPPGKYPNPSVFRQRGVYVAVHLYTDNTILVAVVSTSDPTSGAEAPDVPNAGKTAFKNIVRGLSFEDCCRRADVIDIGGCKQVALGKRGVWVTHGRKTYSRVHLLIPLAPVDATAALGTFVTVERALAKRAARDRGAGEREKLSQPAPIEGPLLCIAIGALVLFAAFGASMTQWGCGLG